MDWLLPLPLTSNFLIVYITELFSATGHSTFEFCDLYLS